MPHSRRGSHSALSYSLYPLLFNIKQAQALNSSAMQSTSEQTSGRQSARLSGGLFRGRRGATIHY